MDWDNAYFLNQAGEPVKTVGFKLGEYHQPANRKYYD